MVEPHGHAWGHAGDKSLLRFVQAFSAQLDGQVSACRRSLDDLSQSATDLTTDLARVATGVSLLSNARFIEMQVEEPDDLFLPRPLSATPSEPMSPRDAAQAARRWQAQTLQQALAAVTAGNRRASHHGRPLPHIYGSAEYLQDSQAGLGAGDESAGEAAVMRSDARGPFMSEPESSPLTSDGEASELESLRDFSQGGAPGRAPDFRSMLEAALRGEAAPGLGGAPWALQGGGDGGPPGTARSTRSLGGFSELWSASEATTQAPYQRSSLRRPSGGGGSSAGQSPAGPPRLQRTSCADAATFAAHSHAGSSGAEGGTDARVMGATAAHAAGRDGSGGGGGNTREGDSRRERARGSGEAGESAEAFAGGAAQSVDGAASSDVAQLHDGTSQTSQRQTKRA